jgi:predicted lipoprotein with Yx(FWY)xxD motif
MRRKTTLLMVPAVLVAVVALVVAGCGGGGNDNVTAAPASSAKVSASGGGGATVGVHKGSIGTYLVDSQGRTLYLFEKDKGTMSTCSGACAAAWPLATTTGHPKAGTGVNAALLGTTRSGSSTQLTYAGHPLYRYAGDQAPGDTNGEGLNQFGGGWDVLAPSGHKIEGDESTQPANGGGNGW